jgi:glycine cleavage system H lipoate-binding protein
MLCPFLSESQVRSCRLASVRKLIPHAALTAVERCSTPQYSECLAFREHQPADTGPAPVCPYLQESLMQFCSAAPVTRFVPWSEASVSKCGSGAFHYCDLYLDVTEASSHRTAPQGSEDSLPVPPALHYTANHMWLDRAGDGLCHIGIDALFSRLLGPVERVDFLTASGGPGKRTPSAVLRAGGRDWQIAFPREMNISACNLMLRSDPSRLAMDPYGRGWMFAGTDLDSSDLLTGEAAAHWMQTGTRRLNEFVQERSGCCADGGLIEPGLLATLRREDALVLFNDFLSPGAGAARPRLEADVRSGDKK